MCPAGPLHVERGINVDQINALIRQFAQLLKVVAAKDKLSLKHRGNTQETSKTI